MERHWGRKSTCMMSDGDMTIRCNVGSWIGSWNRKMTIVEKLVKPIHVLC